MYFALREVCFQPGISAQIIGNFLFKEQWKVAANFFGESSKIASEVATSSVSWLNCSCNTCFPILLVL